MKAFNVIIIFLLFLTSVSFFGLGRVEAATCQTTTDIVFSNGMFNDEWHANVSRTELEKRLVAFNPAYGNRQLYKFHLAYASNKDGLGQSTLDQFLEVARYQYPNALIGSFWRWLGGIEAAPQWFQDLMTSAAALFDDITYMVDADFQKQLNGDGTFPGYRALLEDGRRVFIVAHSQGNFYANAVYNTLTRENPDWTKRLGVTAVATPANYVAGGGPHLTLNEDYVIRAIPLALPVTPSLGSSQNIRDLGAAKWVDATIGHNFVTWYLEGSFSREIILNNIDSILNTMDAPFKHDWEAISDSNYLRFYPDMGLRQWPYAYMERCLRDDSSKIGFQTSLWRADKRVEIKAFPLASAETIPAYQGNLANSSGYIVPIPNGVGFTSNLYSNGINYWLNPWQDGYEVSATTTLILTSITWDRTSGTWMEASSEMELPSFSLNYQNPFGCIGQCPLPQDFGYDPATELPAYGSTVSVTSSYYLSSSGAFQTGPNQSIFVYIAEHGGNVPIHYLAIMDISDGQISSRPSIEIPMTADDYYSSSIFPYSMGLPDRYVDPPRLLRSHNITSKIQLMP